MDKEDAQEEESGEELAPKFARSHDGSKEANAVGDDKSELPQKPSDQKPARNGLTFWGSKEDPQTASKFAAAVAQSNASEEGSDQATEGSPLGAATGSARDSANTARTSVSTNTDIHSSETTQKRAAAYALESEEVEGGGSPKNDASQPGAYSSGPGNEDPQRREHVNYSRIGVTVGLRQEVRSDQNMPRVTTNQEEGEEEETPVPPPSLQATEAESTVVPQGDQRELVVPVAHAVSILELPQAEAVDRGPQNQERRSATERLSPRNKKKRINVMAALVAVSLALTIILSVVLSRPRRDNSGETTPAATPREKYIQQILSYETLAALNVSTSVQSRAFAWLANDPELYDYPEWRLKQRFALVSLYYASNGDTWTVNASWLTYGGHECQWYHRPSFGLVGVVVSANATRGHPMNPCQDGVYRHLWLNTNQLEGTLPFELFEMLPSLRTLSLHANNLAGTLSSSIGKLTHLEAISLANTKLFGVIPSELGLLKNLTYLLLLANQLESTIPTELGNLEKLQFLLMDNNALTGTVPTELGLLSTKLSMLYLQSNFLTGKLPSELGLLSELSDLQLQENSLTGSIPKSFGSLSSVAILNAENNLLTGKLPSELGLLGALTDLDLQHNRLSGSIPATFGQLVGLRYLYLNDNRLSGSMPSEIGNLRNLITLLLFRNSFINNQQELRRGLSGSIPSELGQMVALVHLGLHNSGLQGSIPTEIGNLVNLTWINLFDNELAGALPSEIGKVGKLQHLVLGNNRLSGSIPTEIGSLASLLEMDLSRNSIDGTIPPELGLLSKLVSIATRGNRISGRTPSELAALTALTTLDLGHNLLSGETIPLGRLRALESLALDHNLLTKFSHTWDLPESLSQILLSGNAITGGIPYGIFRLRELRLLALDSNQLSGSVPSELGLFPNLETLRLGANALGGTIPVDIFRSNRLAELRLESNLLSGSIPWEIVIANKSLQMVNLSNNNLTFQIPWSIGDLTELRNLDLSFNALTGYIPAYLLLLSNLQHLSLESNMLSGPIPRDLEHLTNLEGLFLGKNHLTGVLLFAPLLQFDINGNATFVGGEGEGGFEDVHYEGENETLAPNPSSGASLAFALPWWMLFAAYPAWWMASAQQTEGWRSEANASLLDIYDKNEIAMPLDWESLNASLSTNNNDTITTPPGTGGHKLKFYSLHDNYLTGQIPTQTGALTKLEELILDNNGLLGPIPSQIGLLTKLKTFSAGGQNDFFGVETSIGPDVGLLAVNGSLESFRATFLEFSGAIPISFCSLDSLEVCLKTEPGKHTCYCSCKMDMSCVANVTSNYTHWAWGNAGDVNSSEVF